MNRHYTLLLSGLALCLCFAPGKGQAWDLVINNGTVQAEQPMQLVSANPYERQVVDTSTRQVTLTFSQPVRPDKSYIRVTDMFGTQLNPEQPDSNGYTISTEVPQLKPGKYSVKWRARCRCEEDVVLDGKYSFTVQ